jgi:RNA polymerase sigma-70 factor (ECF subfamily)
MAVVVERAPPHAGAAHQRQVRRLRPVMVLRWLGALMAVTGMALALIFGVAPVRVTVQQQVPVEQVTGERGLGLTATGQTQAETGHVTCVPALQFDSATDQNPVCQGKVHGRLGVAFAGLLLFVLGGVLWVVTHGDRAVGFSERRPFIRNSLDPLSGPSAGGCSVGVRPLLGRRSSNSGGDRGLRMEPESADWELGLHRRLLARQHPAFADLYDQYAAVVFGVAMRVTGNRQAAEDVSQAVFLEAWEHPDHFDPARGSWRSWLATVAHHGGVDSVRRELAGRARDGAQADDGFERVPDVGEAMESLLTAEQVRLELTKLSDDERTPIRLAYFEGRTYRQVARDLALPEGTVKSRIRSGLHHMAEALDSEVVGQET